MLCGRGSNGITGRTCDASLAAQIPDTAALQALESHWAYAAAGDNSLLRQSLVGVYIAEINSLVASGRAPDASLYQEAANSAATQFPELYSMGPPIGDAPAARLQGGVRYLPSTELEPEQAAERTAKLFHVMRQMWEHDEKGYERLTPLARLSIAHMAINMQSQGGSVDLGPFGRTSVELSPSQMAEDKAFYFQDYGETIGKLRSQGMGEAEARRWATYMIDVIQSMTVPEKMELARRVQQEGIGKAWGIERLKKVSVNGPRFTEPPANPAAVGLRWALSGTNLADTVSESVSERPADAPVQPPVKPTAGPDTVTDVRMINGEPVLVVDGIPMAQPEPVRGTNNVMIIDSDTVHPALAAFLRSGLNVRPQNPTMLGNPVTGEVSWPPHGFQIEDSILAPASKYAGNGMVLLDTISIRRQLEFHSEEFRSLPDAKRTSIANTAAVMIAQNNGFASFDGQSHEVDKGLLQRAAQMNGTASINFDALPPITIHRNEFATNLAKKHAERSRALAATIDLNSWGGIDSLPPEQRATAARIAADRALLDWSALIPGDQLAAREACARNSSFDAEGENIPYIWLGANVIGATPKYKAAFYERMTALQAERTAAEVRAHALDQLNGGAGESPDPAVRRFREAVADRIREDYMTDPQFQDRFVERNAADGGIVGLHGYRMIMSVAETYNARPDLAPAIRAAHPEIAGIAESLKKTEGLEPEAKHTTWTYIDHRVRQMERAWERADVTHLREARRVK